MVSLVGPVIHSGQIHLKDKEHVSAPAAPTRAGCAHTRQHRPWVTAIQRA